MRVIPVMDLKRGQVVQAIAGRRSSYLPVTSRIAPDARPASVARAWVQAFGFQYVYVADLDAIGGEAANRRAWEEIAECGLHMLLDAGVGDEHAARQLLDCSGLTHALEAVVVGLESLRSESDLGAVQDILGSELAMFSVDLQGGRPRTAVRTWQTRTAVELADLAVQAGFRRLIVLDLERVGVGRGPSLIAACAQIRAAHPDIEMISGGGVRDMADIQALAQAGCNAALVASALHDGRITPGHVAVLCRAAGPQCR